MNECLNKNGMCALNTFGSLQTAGLKISTTLCQHMTVVNAKRDLLSFCALQKRDSQTNI